MQLSNKEIQETMFSKCWKDPVWSKVIAAVIIAFAGYIYTEVPIENKKLIINLLFETLNIPIWLTLVLLLLYVFTISKINTTKSITSNEWFNIIAKNLSDCTYARLYLRSFDHPDQFQDKHRKQLMKIISLISEKIQSGADIKIVSYCKSTKSKTGIDWLKSELNDPYELNHHIKIINNQPVSNSSSLYLFDDKSIVYNKRKNGTMTYHVEDFSNSILHKLISLGIENI